MFSTRIIALAATLALALPAAADARAKKPRPFSPVVTAGSVYDDGTGGGAFSAAQCDAIAEHITAQIAIAVGADLDTAAGRAAFAAAKAQIDQWLNQGMDGGCYFVGIEMP